MHCNAPSYFSPFSFTINFWLTLLSFISDCSHDKPVKQCNCNQYWHINNQYWHINNQYWHMNNLLIYFYTSILISFHYKIFKHGFMNYWNKVNQHHNINFMIIMIATNVVISGAVVSLPNKWGGELDSICQVRNRNYSWGTSDQCSPVLTNHSGVVGLVKVPSQLVLSIVIQRANT